MKKGLIILGIVLIIAFYILNKVNTAKQLTFSLGLPLHVSLKGGALTFDLPLTAINVTQGSINVKGANLDVTSNGTYLGKALVTEPVKIIPSGRSTITAHVSIDYFSLGTVAGNIINLFKSGKINLNLDGYVFAEGFQVPLSQSFDFDAKAFI